MFTVLEVDNLRSDATAGVNSHFAVVIGKETLQMLAFLECVVLSPSLYAPYIGEYSTTIHLHFREQLPIILSIHVRGISVSLS